ncbi:MAG: dienelactone hydrolase family protein [Myxococcales bacterium]|nr:dienelactone hydrolase family protein [Myxococcales bacterium]
MSSLTRTGGLVLVWLATVACGGSSDEPKGASGGSAGAAGAAAGGSAGAASGGGAGSGGTAGAPSGGSGGGGGVADPSAPGPNGGSAFDATANVAATGHQVPMHCVLPVGPSSATAPVVLIAHGFQLPAKQYYGYADRLASHGFIACTADFPAGFSADHAANAQDISGALDWVLVQSVTTGSPLQGRVNIDQIGVMGHSLGGKVSVLAAKKDVRMKAVLGLDPVDTAVMCDATKCPDASDAQPLGIPTAYLGETLDGSAGLGGQACAPTADNFQTFYAKAGSPSLEVTLNGANHMSFIDDVASCGFACGARPGHLLAKQARGERVRGATAGGSLSRRQPVAFFGRHLRGRRGRLRRLGTP